MLAVGVAIVAAIASLIVIVGLSYTCWFRKKSASRSEGIVIFLYQLSIVRIVLSCVGIFASFAYVSCALTLASGVLGFLTLKNLQFAIATNQRFNYAQSCSTPTPLFAAHLTVVAFGYVTVLPALATFRVLARSCASPPAHAHNEQYRYDFSSRLSRLGFFDVFMFVSVFVVIRGG
jgi:hypothetical protein